LFEIHKINYTLYTKKGEFFFVLKLQQLILIVKLARLNFIVAELLVYLLGVLLVVVLFNQFSWERFLLGYAVLLPAHLMVNYSNDYFDVEVDQYSSPTQFSGGSGVLLSHPELRSFARNFSLAMIALSLSLGVVFSYLFNSLVFLLITICGNLLGWFYAAPPVKLAYRGWGEIATMTSGFFNTRAGICRHDQYYQPGVHTIFYTGHALIHSLHIQCGDTRPGSR